MVSWDLAHHQKLNFNVDVKAFWGQDFFLLQIMVFYCLKGIYWKTQVGSSINRSPLGNPTRALWLEEEPFRMGFKSFIKIFRNFISLAFLLMLNSWKPMRQIQMLIHNMVCIHGTLTLHWKRKSIFFIKRGLWGSLLSPSVFLVLGILPPSEFSGTLYVYQQLYL